MADQVRPAKKWYWVAVAIALSGVGLALGIGLPVLMKKVRAFPRAVMPGSQELALAGGEHTLFHEQRSVVDGKSYAGDSLSGVRCGIVALEGGAAVEIRSVSGSTSYTMGSYQGVSMARFTAPKSGRYRLTCDADAGQPPFVIALGQGMMGAILMTVLPAVAAFLGGAILFYLVRRRRKRALAALAPSAA